MEVQAINRESRRERWQAYRHRPLSLLLRLAVTLSAAITVFVLIALVAYILIKGIPNLKPSLFAWKYTTENVSMLPAIINTITMTVLSLLMVLTHPFEPYSVFYIMAAVACLYMAFLKNEITARQQYKSILAISEGGEWKRSVSFEEDFVLVDDGFADDSAMKIPYENITCVRQKNGVYTLYVRGGGVICLYDDCFTEGDWEQCKAQLSAKNPKIKFK